jgi:hypothetical protein
MADDVTTFEAAFNHLLTAIEGLVGSTGANSSVEVRKVTEGENIVGSAPLAHINVRVQTLVPQGRADLNKVWKVQLGIQVRTEIRQTRGAHTEIFAKVALVQDFLDAYRKPDGVEGLDNTEWSVSFPAKTDSGNEIHADSIMTMTLVVAPNANAPSGA